MNVAQNFRICIYRKRLNSTQKREREIERERMRKRKKNSKQFHMFLMLVCTDPVTTNNKIELLEIN